MSRAHADRNRRLRARRAQGWSQRRLAREFRITQTRVVQILATTGGDPLATELSDLAAQNVVDLERERDRLQDRIRTDRRRLRMVLDEIDARRINGILGLTG